MIGTPLVWIDSPHDVTGPVTNGDFADGLTGWRPYSSSGSWTVDAEGLVHPTTRYGTDIGLWCLPSNMVPLGPDKVDNIVTVTGSTPVAGTISASAPVSYDPPTDPDPASSYGTGTPVPVAAGPFSLTFELYLDNSRYAYIGPGFTFRPTVTNPYPDLSTFTIHSLTLNRTDPRTDITCLVDRASIQHGRDDPTTQPDASTVTIDLSFDTAVDPSAQVTLAAVEIGADVSVSVVLDGITYPRFIGKTTDIALSWDDAGAETPTHLVGQVIATSGLARLGRVTVGDEPWPQQLEGARAARIFQLASRMGGFAYAADPGTVQVFARDVDRQPALGLLQELAESAEGTVWQRIDGAVCYADARHRSAGDPALVLDACDVLVTPTWKRDLQGLVNSVSIGWGATEGDEEQSRYETSDQESILDFGLYEYSVGTQLATRDDAVNLGADVLDHRATPAWNLAALPVDVVGLDAARTAELLVLDMHSLIRLENLPAASTTPTNPLLWVEGWVEVLTGNAHELTLSVSDYARSGPGLLWDGVDPNLTWDGVNPTVTWDEATSPDSLTPTGS